MWPKIWYVYVAPCIGSWRYPIDMAIYSFSLSIDSMEMVIFHCYVSSPEGIPTHIFVTLFGWLNTRSFGTCGGSVFLESPLNEPLKIPWLIDCYRGLYYLVYWGL